MLILNQSLKLSKKAVQFKKLLNKTCYKTELRQYFCDTARKFITFDEVIAQRREEAERSLVVQVNSESSFEELYTFCSKYVEIRGIHHYTNSQQHYMLLEFGSNANLNEVLQTCGAHHEGIDYMSVKSPFVWFRAVSGKKNKLQISNESLVIKDGNTQPDEEQLLQDLMTSASVSDQIQLLYNRTVLNDLGVRLRFMVARQLECVFKSIYANIMLRPFGSSVNGFGRMGCDLDLSLTNVMTNDVCDPERRLVYQTKKFDDRIDSWHSHMELVAELIKLRVPGVTRVIKIFNARIPIMKYTHEMTGTQCDLCFNNMSGVYMSELLWIYGSLDPRVRPLAFLIRRWAQANRLTSPHPGGWITNFPLTLMVLFFLQHVKVLPSLNYLINKAGKQDVRIAEGNLNCTFLRDMNKLPTDSYSQNDSNLETLVHQFFEFYSQFNFIEKGISINNGEPIRKPNFSPLYIVNPLEVALNVSRNVTHSECERLKMEIKNAACQLETELDRKIDERKKDVWGILGLIEKKDSRELQKLLRLGNSQRLLSLQDIFRDKEENDSERLSNKLQRLTLKSDQGVEKSVMKMKDEMIKVVKKKNTLRYKNKEVGKAIKNIKNKIIR